MAPFASYIFRCDVELVDDVRVAMPAPEGAKVCECRSYARPRRRLEGCIDKDKAEACMQCSHDAPGLYPENGSAGAVSVKAEDLESLRLVVTITDRTRRKQANLGGKRVKRSCLEIRGHCQ
jgi:hypothetical protein